MFFFEEYTLFENLMLLVALYAGPIIAYFVFKPLLIRYLEKRSDPVEPGADAPDDIFWKDDDNSD